MGTYTFRHEGDEGLVVLSFDDSEYILHQDITRRFVDFLNGCGFQVERCDIPDLHEQAIEANKDHKQYLKSLHKKKK